MAIEVFGAGAVQSAYVSYLPIDIRPNNITLLWPTSYVNVPYTDPITNIHYNVLAAWMDVNTNDENENTITLPDATKSSVGSNIIVKNVGAGDFNIHTSDNNILLNIGTGLRYSILLTDNSTPAGMWSVVQFGAGVSQASANLLAGNGLVALGATLNSDTPIINAFIPL